VTTNQVPGSTERSNALAVFAAASALGSDTAGTVSTPTSPQICHRSSALW
jgi:hypothetical protein